MKVVTSISGWHPSFGGPFVSSGNLMRELVARGVDVTLFTVDFPDQSPAEPPPGVRLVSVKGVLVPILRHSITPSAYRDLNHVVDDWHPDVLHDNGLWRSLNYTVSRVASRRGIPQVLSPRGAMDASALSHRGWKKKIALAMSQRKALEAVACFHATSDREVEAIRDFGLTQPIGLIPNGVALPEKRADFSEVKERTALFLGRIHPIKNLEQLVRSWASANPQGWRLLIVGNAEDGYDHYLKKLIIELGLTERVALQDAVYGEDKEKLLLSAQLFFLVSHTENFGIAAAEAMAHGLPVVASKNTPWAAVKSKNCGWWVDPYGDDLIEAIREATGLSPEALETKGKVARDYMLESFSWATISRDFERLYGWLSGTGPRPQFVVEA